MVTTRSQSVSPRKRKSAAINYAQLASPTTSTTTPHPTPSPRKRSTAVTKSKPTPSPTKKRPASPRKRSMAEEIVVQADSHDDAEYVNGSAIANRSAAKSPRKTSAASTRGMSGDHKPKNKPAHKVDKSGKFAFGGPVGTGAMMIFFPILMYYLWICSTFYGGKLEVKRYSETWLAFLDRMVAHVTKVPTVLE
jgi:hypothetical protein